MKCGWPDCTATLDDGPLVQVGGDGEPDDPTPWYCLLHATVPRLRIGGPLRRCAACGNLTAAVMVDGRPIHGACMAEQAAIDAESRRAEAAGPPRGAWARRAEREAEVPF
jgi:hypothetical protein